MSEDTAQPAKEPCPICNQPVTTMKGMRACHMKRCAAKAAAVAAPRQEPPPMQDAPTAPVATKPATPPKPAANKPVIKNDEDRLLYERALQAQAMYAKAPDAFVAENSADEYTEIRRVYAPDTFDKFDDKGKLVQRAPFHEFFGLPERKHTDVAKGYVPVFNEHGEMVTGPNGEILYKLDRKIHDAKEAAAQRESESRIASARQRQSNKNTAGVDDIEPVGEHDIRELEASRTRGSLEDLRNMGE